MSTVGAVGTITNTDGTTTSEEQRNLNDISPDAFLELLVLQLSNQDPLNPMDNEQFLTQMAEMQSLQEQRKTADNTEAMLQSNQMASATSMLGKWVDYIDDEGELKNGIVETVRLSDGSPRVKVNEDIIDILNVREVTDPDMWVPTEEGGG